MTRTVTQKLQAFIDTWLRYVIGIRWSNTISGKELGERTGHLPADELIRRRKWQWIWIIHYGGRHCICYIRHAMSRSPLEHLAHNSTGGPQGSPEVMEGGAANFA